MTKSQILNAQVCIENLQQNNRLVLEELSPKRTDICSSCGKLLEVQNVRFGRFYGVAVCARCLIKEQTFIEQLKIEASNNEFDFENETSEVSTARAKLSDSTKTKIKPLKKTRSNKKVDKNQLTLFELYEQTLNDLKL